MRVGESCKGQGGCRIQGGSVRAAKGREGVEYNEGFLIEEQWNAMKLVREQQRNTIRAV